MSNGVTESGRQYVPLFFDFVDSKAFNQLSGNALKLYVKMRRYVCRARSGHSLCDFYIKGVLAMSGYLSQYATAFNVSKSSISRWLQELEDAKFIVTYYTAERGRNTPNIWILGKVSHIEGSKHGVEIFFMDHEAMAQEPDDEVTKAFDQSKADVVLANMNITEDLTAGLTVAPMQQTVAPVEHTVAPMQRSNREDLIEKTNSVPPPKAESEKPSVKEIRKRLLQSTKTQGKDDPIIRSSLSEYIGQQFNSPVPAGGCNKLASRYCEQLAGGHKQWYMSPDQLWLEHPLFPTWVEDRIKYIKGSRGGSNAKMRSYAVNAICQYKGNAYAWLEWLSRQSTAANFRDVNEEPPPVGDAVLTQEQKDAGPVRFKPIEGPSEEDIRWYEEREKDADSTPAVH